MILEVLSHIVEFPTDELGVMTSIFESSVTSIDLIALKSHLEKRLMLSNEIPVGMLLANPTIRGIANSLERIMEPSRPYNPVAPLQTQGTKTPLWLIHPASGDVLIFLALAKHLTDRPVYGLRIRGLNEGEDYFSTIYEASETYYEKIKQNQPTGPYALAGYSLGSIIAYETAKLFEAAGDEVKFLGLFDMAPHVKQFLENLDWVDALLNVAYFLELISEEYAKEIVEAMHKVSHDEVLEHILQVAPAERLEAISLDKANLIKITNTTAGFGSSARTYDPSGKVASIDVFWVTPLVSMVKTRKEWMEKHLIQWNDFCVSEPRMHECEGTHSRMLNSEYVFSFQKKLRAAMAARGI